MNRHIIISIIGHLLVLIALVIPAFLPRRPMPPVQMVTVRAVTPQSISRLLESVEEPAQPKPQVPQVTVPKENLLPDPKKNTRKVQTVKRADKQAPEKNVADAKSPGKKGLDAPEGVETDQKVDIEYLALVVQIIHKNWQAPKSNDLSIKSVVFFEIAPDGKMVRIRVETRSGNMIFDKSAYDAIMKSNPLPPLPANFTSDKLGIHLTFSY